MSVTFFLIPHGGASDETARSGHGQNPLIASVETSACNVMVDSARLRSAPRRWKRSLNAPHCNTRSFLCRCVAERYRSLDTKLKSNPLSLEEVSCRTAPASVPDHQAVEDSECYYNESCFPDDPDDDLLVTARGACVCACVGCRSPQGLLQVASLSVSEARGGAPCSCYVVLRPRPKILRPCGAGAVQTVLATCDIVRAGRQADP